MAAKNPTVPAALPQPSPIFEFSIRQRAGLHVLGNALEHLAGGSETVRDASEIIWSARERVLKAAEYWALKRRKVASGKSWSQFKPRKKAS